LATNPGTEQDGPQDKLLKLAASSDGMTYVSNGEIVSFQANGPDMIVDAQGRILLYYTGWILGDRLYRSAVAISQDEGKSWTYKYLELTGGDEYLKPTEIDAVLLEDGSVRIFYSSGNPSVGTGIHYAQSTDGINFTYKGVVFAPKDYTAKKPTVFQADGLWHLYASSDNDAGQVWHLTSVDGVNFDVYALTSFPVDEKPSVPSNGVWLGERYHMFLSTLDGDIRSFWTTDGNNWMPDEGTRLSKTGDEQFVADATIIPLASDRFLMVYTTTTIPF
jgi:hypothetical protein